MWAIITHCSHMFFHYYIHNTSLIFSVFYVFVFAWLRPVCSMSPVSLDCQFWIASSVFLAFIYYDVHADDEKSVWSSAKNNQLKWQMGTIGKVVNVTMMLKVSHPESTNALFKLMGSSKIKLRTSLICTLHRTIRVLYVLSRLPLLKNNNAWY